MFGIRTGVSVTPRQRRKRECDFMDIVITPGVNIEICYMHKTSKVQTHSVITIPERK